MNFKKTEKAIDFSKITEYNSPQKKNVCSILKGDMQCYREKNTGPVTAALEAGADGH